VRTVGSAVYVGNVPHGIARVAIALLPYDVSFGTKEALTHRVPLHIVSAPMNVAVTPETNTVQVEKITV
jgi:hypothetical protein